MDLYSTIADIIDVTVPTDIHIDGRNILPLVRGETSISPHDFMFHYCGEFIHAVRYRPRTGTLSDLHPVLTLFQYLLIYSIFSVILQRNSQAFDLARSINIFRIPCQ